MTKKRLVILGITAAALGGLLALLLFPLGPATVTHAQTALAVPATGLPVAGSGPAESSPELWWLLVGASSAAMIVGAGLVVAARRLRDRI